MTDQITQFVEQNSKPTKDQRDLMYHLRGCMEAGVSCVLARNEIHLALNALEKIDLARALEIIKEQAAENKRLSDEIEDLRADLRRTSNHPTLADFNGEFRH